MSVRKKLREAYLKSELAKRSMTVDYKTSTEIPIRDMHRDGKIAFVVTIYGLDGADLCVIPGGSRPMQKAVERLGLDPMRYQSILWDIKL